MRALIRPPDGSEGLFRSASSWLLIRAGALAQFRATSSSEADTGQGSMASLTAMLPLELNACLDRYGRGGAAGSPAGSGVRTASQMPIPAPTTNRRPRSSRQGAGDRPVIVR